MDVTSASFFYPLIIDIIFLIAFFYILFSQGYHKGKNMLRVLATPIIIVTVLSILNLINIYNIPLPPNNRVYWEAHGDLLFLRMLYSYAVVVDIIAVLLMIIGLILTDIRKTQII